MSIDCADLRNCRLEVTKRTDGPNVFHFCLDPTRGTGARRTELAMCDNREAIDVTLRARDALRTAQGTRDMMEIVREIIKSKGCVIIRVASQEDFAYLRLMRALYKESLEQSWMTYVDGDEGLYSRALLAIGGSERYYALPFRHRCSFHLTKCATVVETWGKLWVVLPPCAEFTHAGCPVTADDYVPVVSREIGQVAIASEEQSGEPEEPEAPTGAGGDNESEQSDAGDTDDAVSSVNEEDMNFTDDNEAAPQEDTGDSPEDSISSDDDA